MSPHAAAEPAAPAPPAAFELAAFGLHVRADWPLPGSVAAVGETPAERNVTVRRLTEAEFEAGWDGPVERVFEPEYPDGKTRVTVDLGEGRYRLWFDGFGRYLVSEDGTSVGCEPEGFGRERQERLLFAQALPLAAALQGLDLLHASAVETGAGVAALVGPSGAGKTTLASRLVLRGRPLVTDDVLVLERGDGAPLAHPGAPIMVLRPEDAARLGALGPAVGTSDKVHVSVPTALGPRPLASVYYLERSDVLEIAPLEETDIGRALGSVFAPYLTTRGRLTRHLDTVRSLSGSVSQFRLCVPRDGRLDDTLDALEAHMTRRRS